MESREISEAWLEATAQVTGLEARCRLAHGALGELNQNPDHPHAAEDLGLWVEDIRRQGEATVVAIDRFLKLYAARPR